VGCKELYIYLSLREIFYFISTQLDIKAQRKLEYEDERIVLSQRGGIYLFLE